MEEVWREVEGYEGYYAVSNFGRVKSLPRTTISDKGKRYTCVEKILKIATRKDRYQFIILRKNNKSKLLLIHRLVAQAFIPNPNKLPMINHKDENPSNNRVDNLEWCDQKYNMNYGTCRQRIGKASKLRCNSPEGKVRQSEIMRNFYANNSNPNKGKKRTEEQKAYMRQRQLEGIKKWKERKLVTNDI